MRRTFIQLAEFDRAWTELGLGDDELNELESRLTANPDAGDVIPGLGGARKLRIPIEEHGKRGGGRVIYVDVVISERIYLITAYAQNVQVDLTPDQKKKMRSLVGYIKKEG